jgi:hypothetical protein
MSTFCSKLVIKRLQGGKLCFSNLVRHFDTLVDGGGRFTIGER